MYFREQRCSMDRKDTLFFHGFCLIFFSLGLPIIIKVVCITRQPMDTRFIERKIKFEILEINDLLYACIQQRSSGALYL
jgi:hypothetical protein